MKATLAQLRSTLALQMAQDRMRMAGNLVRLRDEKRWTQDRLVEESGVSKSTVQRIERGKGGAEIRVSTIDKLADALGVTPETITDGAVLAADSPTPDLMGQYGEGMSQLDRIEWKLDALLLHFEISAAEIEAGRRAAAPADEQGGRQAA